MKCSLLGWLVTTIVAVVVHEIAGRHLVSVDLVLAATRQDLVDILIAAALIFSRLWLMFVLPTGAGAILASRIWRLVSGRTPTEERLRKSL